MNALKRCLALLAFVILFFPAKVLASDSVTVYIFLSETCPICQSVTVNLRNLYKEYHSKRIEFVGIFPNVNVSTKASIEKFAKKYQLSFPLKLDDEQTTTARFSATITPQIFVVNESNKEVVYKGRIDNGYERVGKKRQVITEHYLKNALDELSANLPVSQKETESVGCFIIKK